MAGCLNTAAQIGDAVGGFATLAGLWFAWRSVNRWRNDRLDDRRAEAAGRAYVGLRRACVLLSVWAESCSMLLKAHRSDRPLAGPSYDTFRSHNEWRQANVREAVVDLRETAQTTSVYLEESELQLLLEVEPIWQAIGTDAAPIGATDRSLSDAMIDKMCERFDGYAADARALLARGTDLREVGRYRRPPRRRTTEQGRSSASRTSQ